MAVTVTQIDGQNVGLRLLGQTSVQPLALNLTTGEVTSAYIPAETLPILQGFALKLFQTVPVSARSAAAIGLLSRLCAVSPADASTVALTATVASGVATLTASITASPGTLLLTVPYSPSGGVMPSSGGGGGAPGPGEDGSTVSVPRGEAVVLGNAVYVTNTGTAFKADASAASTMPCVGIVQEATDPDNAANCIIRCAGILTGLGGLTPGSIYFADYAGGITASPPNNSGDRVQAVGFAVSATTLAVALSGVVTVR